jgi:tetratricopeptide (TPR) repeat protein
MRQFYLTWMLVLAAFVANASGEDALAMAKQYAAQKNYSMAATYFAKAIAAGNTSTDVQAMYADVLYLGKSYGEALKQYTALNATDKSNKIYTARLCELLYKNRKYNEIIVLTKDLKAKDVDDEYRYIVMMAKATALEKNFIYPAAIEAYSVALPFATDKQAAEINYNIAMCYAELNSWNKAEPYFAKSVATDSNNHSHLAELAILYLNVGKIDQAIYTLQRAFDKGWPKTWDNYYELANAYYEKKDYQSCIDYLTEAQKQNPYNQDIASLIAFSYYNKGETKRAREMLDKMLEINPDNAETIYLYGLTYQKDDKLDKAERYFEKAFRLKPALEKLRVQKFQF